MESCSGHECRVKRKGVECSICREKKESPLAPSGGTGPITSGVETEIRFKQMGQMTKEDCPKIYEDGSNRIQAIPEN